MKFRSILLLMLAEIAALSLWFVSASIMPGIQAEVDISPMRQAALSSSVQLGFVAGALVSAILGLADRYDPRRVFALSAFLAAAVNASLLVTEPGGNLAILARFLTGALLAGIYPVGMKIAVGWGEKDRGFLVGALVGALVLGSASPHLVSLLGGADWRWTITIVSFAAIFAGIACLFAGLGPYHRKAAAFDPKIIWQAWNNKKVRLAYAGYLAHMWELYAMWAWIGVAATFSYAATMTSIEAQYLGTLTAFVAIAAGSVTSLIVGYYSDSLGKENAAIISLVIGGAAAVLSAVTFGGPIWLSFVVFVIWGAFVVSDSAQFSALVADHSPPEQAGSLMTLQTALGFALTFFTVQLTPLVAEQLSWPSLFLILAIGPVLGTIAMYRLKAITS